MASIVPVWVGKNKLFCLPWNILLLLVMEVVRAIKHFVGVDTVLA